jgi:hypothetical protein
MNHARGQVQSTSGNAAVCPYSGAAQFCQCDRLILSSNITREIFSFVFCLTGGAAFAIQHGLFEKSDSAGMGQARPA